jgi:hypothetical protein
VSFAAITFCVASQRVFILVVYFIMTQSGNFWIHPRIWQFKWSVGRLVVSESEEAPLGKYLTNCLKKEQMQIVSTEEK